MLVVSATKEVQEGPLQESRVRAQELPALAIFQERALYFGRDILVLLLHMARLLQCDRIPLAHLVRFLPVHLIPPSRRCLKT